MLPAPSGRDIKIVILSLILAFPVILDIQSEGTGLNSTITRQENIPSSEFTFFNYTLYQESSLVYRAGVGDLIPEREGLEMATSSVDGIVSVHYGAGLSWNTETAHRSYIGVNSMEKAPVYSIDVEDLIPEREGDEIVAVDEDRSVYLIYREGSRWVSDLIFKESERLLEVDIGNIHGDPEQPEIVIVGDNRTVTVLSRTETGWNWEVIYQDPFYLDTCFIADIYPEIEGNEIITAGGSGDVTVIHRENDAWISTDIYSFGTSVSVLDIICIDMDPRYDGLEVIAATYDKKVMSVYRSAGGWEAQIIHNEGNLVYCLEYGMLVNDSLTIAAATWNGRTGLIYHDGTYKFREIYREQYEMYGCHIADIDPTHRGNELISLSRLGRITMSYRDDPGAVIELPFNRTTVHPGETIRIPLIVRYKGGYQGQTGLSASGGTLSTETIQDTSISILSFTAPETEGITEIDISAVSGEMTTISRITILVEDESIPVSLGPYVINTEIGADRQVEEIFYGFSNENLNEAMKISVINVPKGLTATLSRSLCEPCEKRDFLSLTVSAASWTDPDIYQFFIVGSSQGIMQRALAISIIISERNLADLIMIMDDDDLILDVGETECVDLKMISINGFNESTEIIVHSYPTSLSVNTSLNRVIPTENLTVSITGISEGGPFIIVIEGRGASITRFIEFRVEVIPPAPDLEIIVPTEQPVYNVSGNGLLTVDFKIKLSPTYEVIENVKIVPKTPANNYTLELDRDELQRVPYSIDVGIRISGNRESVPDSLVLEITFDGPGSPKEVVIELKIPEDVEKNGSDPGFTLILIPVLIILAIFSAGLYLLLSGRKSNHLNRNYDHQESDDRKPGSRERDHLSPESNQTGEPVHRRHGGPGRMGHQHR